MFAPQFRQIFFKKNNFLFVFFCVFFIHFFAAWPGYLAPDSLWQYEMALSGKYCDHHPFFMSFFWRQLMFFWGHFGVLLFFHLIMCYTGLFFMALCIPLPYRFLSLFYPFIPTVFFYTDMLVKDVGYAFSFLAACGYLSYISFFQKKISLKGIIFVFFLLLYGVLVKFQGQYIVLVPLIWISLHLTQYQLTKNFLKKFCVLGSLFFGSVFFVEKIGPEVKQNHSWQKVKIFDLAAISIERDKLFIPLPFLKTGYGFKDVKKLFSRQEVDSLNPILKDSEEKKDLDHLWNVWFQKVYESPFLYLKHRLLNRFEGLIEGIQSKENSFFLKKMFLFVFKAHFIYILFSFFYLILGFLSFKKTSAAISLFFLNMTGLSMFFVLTFLSMAATRRYTYISVCLYHASHYFAFVSFRTLFFKKKCSGLKKNLQIRKDVLKIKGQDDYN